jgi:hypothetical protein
MTYHSKSKIDRAVFASEAKQPPDECARLNAVAISLSRPFCMLNPAAILDEISHAIGQLETG